MTQQINQYEDIKIWFNSEALNREVIEVENGINFVYIKCKRKIGFYLGEHPIKAVEKRFNLTYHNISLEKNYIEFIFKK